MSGMLYFGQQCVCAVISPLPNPNLEGQWDHSSSGPHPLTCLAWVSLPGVQDSSQHSSRAHWGMQAAPPRQGGDPNQGRLYKFKTYLLGGD